MKQVPRKKAIQALAQVLADKRYLDQVLEPLMGPVEFENAWLKDVVTGTLRWKGRIDYFIDEFAHKKKPSGKLRRALLIAGYQILEHTEVHPIQVIDETVEWIKQEEGKPPSGFANVLLRKFYEHRQAILELDCDERASLSHKRAVTSLPDWILLPLEKKIGWEKTKKWGLKTLKSAPLWMSSFEVGESTDPIRWDGSGAELKHLLQQSKRYIQDLSSQQVIQWVGEKLPPSLSLLDYCAAPGGKSFGLTRLGYQVTASDLSEDRLATLQVNQERLGIALNGVYSQKDLKKQGMTYDGVWIDAPCSGSGTLQKNPDLKWNRTAKEIESLIYEQKRCVDSAVQYLKPKGYLIYSVCSLLPEEGAEAELWKDLDQTFDKIDELTLGLEKDEGEGFYIKILKKRN